MKKIIILILMICLTHQNVYLDNNLYSNLTKKTNQVELYEGSLLALLYPYISNEVDKYYGYPKQFDLYNAKILSIIKPTERFEYEIIVQVETFTGPHNPPYGIETITVLTSPMGTKTIKFNHKSE